MKKILKNPRKLCDGMMGQNYWFNGCMDYLMECTGENSDFDYWFFSGVTGDSFTQIYSKNPYYSTLCLTDKLLADVISKAFDACGYTYEHISNIDYHNRETYYTRIRESIDREIPVIVKMKITGSGELDSYGVICGYDDESFYYLIGEDTQPTLYPERFFQLIFLGERKERMTIAETYRHTIMEIPAMLTRPETKEFSFGRQAFTNWRKVP